MFTRVLGGRIPASYSIRGSWWKPYSQESVCVPPSEKQQPAYTGIARWNELSFWQKRKRIPGTAEQLPRPPSFDHMPESREASELFVGFRTLVLLSSNVCLPLNYFSKIIFKKHIS